MSDVILAALIGAAASIIVNLLNNFQQAKKRAVAEAVKETELNNRLENIEHKLDTHNRYSEKLGGIQKDVNAIQTSIAVMQTDIKNLYREATK